MREEVRRHSTDLACSDDDDALHVDLAVLAMRQPPRGAARVG
jgi:hypothetical protein